jgi:hypothetical protein
MGEKKKKKKKREEEEIRKKSNVLGCRIILCNFFFYVRCQIVIGGQKPPFTPRPNLSYFLQPCGSLYEIISLPPNPNLPAKSPNPTPKQNPNAQTSAKPNPSPKSP